VIDPILQSTYLGGSNNESVWALAIHPTTGEVYVAGYTQSANFPNTSGGAQSSFGGGSVDFPYDAFVARLNSTLTQILNATYLGGSGNEGASALAIHPTTGEVYVAGGTSSTNFPNTSFGAQSSHRGGSARYPYDAFVARLNSTLTQILNATYLGGSGEDYARALAIGPAPNYYVYVAGETSSADFPRTSGGAQSSYRGGSAPYPHDAFVARLDSTLTQIFQSTYLGGSDTDTARDLAISSDGYVYVAGWTISTDFPKTAGGAQQTYGGGGYYDSFVAKLHPNLQTDGILQSTYLGGSKGDEANAIAIHPRTGEVYVAGLPSTPTFLTRQAGRKQVATAVASDARTLSWRGLAPTSPDFSNPPTWEEAITILPTPLPFIPERARSMWRGAPNPTTSPTRPVARRRAAAAGGTPSWRGLAPTLPPTPSPPTWEETMEMEPTPLPFIP
jgi:hypothetical protein